MSLFVLLPCLIGLWSIIKPSGSANLWMAVVIGIGFAISALVKPINEFFLIAVVIAWPIFYRKSWRLRTCFALLAPVFVIHIIWVAFTVYPGSGHLGLSTKGNSLIDNYVCPMVLADVEKQSGLFARDAVGKMNGREKVAFLLTHPLATAKVYIRGFVSFFAKPIMLASTKEQLGYPVVSKGNPFSLVDGMQRNGIMKEVMSRLRSQPFFICLILAYSIGFLAFVYAGVLLALIRRVWKELWFPLAALFILYFPLLSFGVGNARYRMTIMPILCLVSVWGWSAVVKRSSFSEMEGADSLTIRSNSNNCKEVNDRLVL